MKSHHRSGSYFALTTILAGAALAAAAAALLVAAPGARAQSNQGLDKALYSGMKWRPRSGRSAGGGRWL